MFKLLVSSVGSASPGGDPLATLKMLPDLLAVVERIGKAEEAKDQDALCLAMVDYRAFVTKVDGLTLKQTRATQAALQAEAARLGISLD